MCDPCTKFEEIMVAIVDETFVRTHRQTYTQVILYLSNAMNCIGQTKTKIQWKSRHRGCTGVARVTSERQRVFLRGGTDFEVSVLGITTVPIEITQINSQCISLLWCQVMDVVVTCTQYKSYSLLTTIKVWWKRQNNGKMWSLRLSYGNVHLVWIPRFLF